MEENPPSLLRTVAVFKGFCLHELWPYGLALSALPAIVHWGPGGDVLSLPVRSVELLDGLGSPLGQTGARSAPTAIREWAQRPR